MIGLGFLMYSMYIVHTYICKYLCIHELFMGLEGVNTGHFIASVLGEVKYYLLFPAFFRTRLEALKS